MISRFKPLPVKTKAALSVSAASVDVQALAKALYESRDLKHAPAWAQLGDVTRSVWVGYIQAGQR